MPKTTADALKIVKVEDNGLTFAIPPGQRKYSRHIFDPGNSGDTKFEAKTEVAGDNEQSSPGVDSKLGTARIVPHANTNGGEASEGSEKGDGALVINETAESRNPLDSSKDQEAELTFKRKTDANEAAEARSQEDAEMEANNEPQENGNHAATAPEESHPDGVSSQTNSVHSSTPALKDEDVLHSIFYLKQLENKIVDVDGRYKSEEIPSINTWRAIRAIRNNQDLGTLFEMRETFFVYKYPQIVKEGKKKR